MILKLNVHVLKILEFKSICTKTSIILNHKIIMFYMERVSFSQANTHDSSHHVMYIFLCFKKT